MVDSASGARRVLPGRLVRSAARPPLVIAAPGVIAPGGSAAAVIRAAPGGRLSLHLIGLGDGSDHRIPVRMDQAPIGPQTLAWSPDGRWLFVAAANNTLVAVNARTERIEKVSEMIPPVSEIAIRNSPPAGR